MLDSIVEQCSWVLEAQRKVKEYTHGILNFKSSQITCQIILTFYLYKFLYRHNMRYFHILFQFTTIKYFTVQMLQCILAAIGLDKKNLFPLNHHQSALNVKC